MDMLKEELFEVLRAHGAVLCGVGDMRGFENDDPGVAEMPTGIAVAVPVPAHIVKDLETAPTLEYAEMYDILNARLDVIITAGMEFLQERGYRARANVLASVVVGENKIVPIPHKTYATRAGLGWIGKSCLLVTPEYGGSIRISSLITDAPLPFDEPYDESRCGECMVCVENCPGQALSGKNWKLGVERSQLLDWPVCYEAQCNVMEKNTGVRHDLCGKCYAVCPYTQARLRRELT